MSPADQDLQNESKALVHDHVDAADGGILEPCRTPSSHGHMPDGGILRGSEVLLSAVAMWSLIEALDPLWRSWCAGDTASVNAKPWNGKV